MRPERPADVLVSGQPSGGAGERGAQERECRASCHSSCDCTTAATLYCETAGARMKIVEVKAAGLRGSTPPGGWSSEIVADDCVHTLIVVRTAEGVTTKLLTSASCAPRAMRSAPMPG